jgi:sucrose-6-phosphate hydrolase SacC (GH32 family)
VRIYVDRPVVEIFINGGRAAFTHAVADFALNSTAVRVFNGGKAAVTCSNVSVHGMGCGWTAVAPAP